MLKAVLFDMDGVIIDSEPLHARAAILALSKFNVTLTTEFCYSFIGSTAKHMLEVVREKWQLPFSIETLMQANDAAKKELVAMEGYPAIPGVKKLMEALNQEGFLVAIASSSPHGEILDTVERLQLGGFLQKIVSGMQVAHPKPAPDIFLLAASELGVSPSECIVVEDSTNGLLAAKAAGMARVAFYNPNSGHQDLCTANYIIEGFEEITPGFLCQVYQHANNLPAVIAKSQRLTLRELTTSDMPALHDILSEPSIARFSGEPARTLAERLKLHEAYIPAAYHFRGYGLWGIFLDITGELIGRCGFEPGMIGTSPVIELGYLVSERFQGHGYASEAVNAAISVCSHFGFSKIYAVVHPDNTASIHLAEKSGMKPAGTISRNGACCHVFCLEF